jgi:hypothetical protein
MFKVDNYVSSIYLTAIGDNEASSFAAKRNISCETWLSLFINQVHNHILDADFYLDMLSIRKVADVRLLPIVVHLDPVVPRAATCITGLIHFD